MVGLQRIMYGQLRPLEIEQLYEKAWIAITETCFAMTVFRGEMGVWFLVMFFSLLASRVWIWIGEGRVEILEQQPPPNPRLFHTRLAASLLLSALFNSSMLDFCVKTVLRQAKPDKMVMFAFEFAILTTQSLFIIARYAISLVEILTVRKQKRIRLTERRAEIRAAREEASRQEGENSQPIQHDAASAEIEVDEAELEVPGWEEKATWVLYLELFTGDSHSHVLLSVLLISNNSLNLDFVKLTIYLTFFWIILIFYGFPFHIVRDVYLTFRSFIKRINDFRKYKKAIRDMETRYPDATAEEIAREDVCIICREEMRPIAQPTAGPPEDQARPRRSLGSSMETRMRPKKLPCGHILHFSCLRSWLERQQICPTCRQPVTDRSGGHARNPNRQQANAGGAQNGEPGHNAQQRGAHGQNQARVFQLGPLRVVFGRGRGNLYGDLANQIQHGEGAQRQQEPLNAAGAQQYGFGFGIRAREPQNPPQLPSLSSRPSIQLQLQRIEHELNHEINSLQVTADQLHVVRALQLELERLRMPPNIRPNYSVPQSSSPLSLNLTRPTSSQVLVQNDHSNMLQSGDERLPQGLTLPEGWTMLPLQRVEQRMPGMQAGVQAGVQPGVQIGAQPGMHPAPPNAFSMGMGPMVGESVASHSDSGINGLTPSSSSTDSAPPTVPTATQGPQGPQPVPEALHSFMNANTSRAPVAGTTTGSDTAGNPLAEIFHSITTDQRTNREQSNEPPHTSSSTPNVPSAPPPESNPLPSWSFQTTTTEHPTDSDRRTEAREPLPASTSTPNPPAAAASSTGETSPPSTRTPEREESKAARVEDCIEDMD